MDKFITSNFKETQKLGQNFAREILAKGSQKTAVILGLQGDLGAGKTTFLQGFAKGLGIKEVINSPTFVIMKKFKTRALNKLSARPSTKTKSFSALVPNPKFKYFFHFDCYRLNSPEEILHLGFKEIISNPENIVAIEWPEKIAEVLPKNFISINFEHLEVDQRAITIDNF